MLSRIWSYLQTREGVRFLIRHLFASWRVMGLVFYIISPFDLIPENTGNKYKYVKQIYFKYNCIFGIIGLIDDFMVIIFVLLIICNIYYNHMAR